jgi:hypothetical protein
MRSNARRSIADPVFDRNRKKHVTAAQLHDVLREIVDRELARAAAVAQFPDLNAIEIADLLAQSRRRCLRPRPQAMPRQFLENLRAKCRHTTDILGAPSLGPGWIDAVEEAGPRFLAPTRGVDLPS